MTEVMQTDVWQTSRLECASQGTIDLPKLDRTAASISKDKTDLLPLLRLGASCGFALPMMDQGLPGYFR